MTGIVTATGTLVRRIRLPQRLRNLELALLIGALILTGGALLLVQVGALSHLTSDVALLWVAPAALTVVLHCCLRAVARDADPFFLPVGTLLNGLGIAMIYRIDLANNASGWNSSAMRQVVWTGIAMVCAGATILAVRNHRVLQRYMYIAGFLAIALLLLPLLPGIGLEVNGARVWIGIGDLLTFQPGELVKIALAVFFAGFLVRTRDSLATVGRRFLGLPLPRARDVGPLVVVWLLCMAVIVFQRDLGTAVLYFGVFLVVLYVATGRSSWIILGLTLFTAGGALASQALPYVGARFANWLDPFNPARYDAVTGGVTNWLRGSLGSPTAASLAPAGASANPKSRPSRRAITSSRASAKNSA